MLSRVDGEVSVQIDAGQVLWRAFDGQDYDVYFYDPAWAEGTAARNVSGNTTNDSSFQADDGQVVWVGSDGQDDEIYLYDTAWAAGTAPVNLSDNTTGRTRRSTWPRTCPPSLGSCSPAGTSWPGTPVPTPVVAHCSGSTAAAMSPS